MKTLYCTVKNCLLLICCQKAFANIRKLLQIFFYTFIFIKFTMQKQPSRGVFRKRCSGNMQQIYRRTPMPKYDFNKVALQIYWNRTSAWVFSYNLLRIFWTPFYKNTSGWLLLKIYNSSAYIKSQHDWYVSKILIYLEQL